MKKLNKDEIELLEEIIKKQAPHHLNILNTIGITPLDCKQRDILRDILSSEFCETGLMEDSEPNLRGIKIEKLIDCVFHL